MSVDPSNAEHPLFKRIEKFRRRDGKVRGERVDIAHGGGGKAMRDLIDDVVLGAFGSSLQADEDQARFSLAELVARGDRLAFSTDSYVVSPLEFPGADIGSLAVNGTVNDLAVGGAQTNYLSCELVIEEGLELDVLRRILRSMAKAAEHADVHIVTGDTKVVQRGAADRLFINTAGVGVIPAGRDVRASALRPGDRILVNGYLGDHGAAILLARGELKLEAEIPSDCAPLADLAERLLERVEVHAMRDATRGGLASVLNELALSSEIGIAVDGAAVPVRSQVEGFCEILGLDPLHLANEGKLVVAVAPHDVDAALEVMRAHPLGEHAACVAECRSDPPGVVTLNTGFGRERILDMLVGEQLPRIC